MLFTKVKYNIFYTIIFLILIFSVIFIYIQINRNNNLEVNNINSLISTKFELTNHKNKLVTEKDFLGKYMIVYFGFTFCPDICPNSLNIITSAFKNLPKSLQKKINLVFISVDPERDTVDVLSEYVSYFDTNLIGLTGNNRQILNATKSFGIYYKKKFNSELENDYVVDHSTLIYLFNPQGQYVNHFSHNISSSTLNENLKKIIK